MYPYTEAPLASLDSCHLRHLGDVYATAGSTTGCFSRPLFDTQGSAFAGAELACNAPSLRRIVGALGGKSAGAKTCEICVLGAPEGSQVSAKHAPKGVKRGAVLVLAEWLLSSAEQYQKMPLEDYTVDA